MYAFWGKMFLETNSYYDSKMVCWKILALGIPELTLQIDSIESIIAQDLISLWINPKTNDKQRWWGIYFQKVPTK